MIQIFDEIVDIFDQEIIKNFLYDTGQWSFVKDVSVKDNKQQRPGFNYRFITNSENIYEWHGDVCTHIIDKACDKIKFKRNDCLQGRSFLQLPLNLKDRSIDAPHVDADIDHLVVLYYVIDSDGDTVIYKNKFEGYDNVPKIKELKELKRVTPKAGRVVMFNGKHWHSSFQPEHNVRCVINYNVI